MSNDDSSIKPCLVPVGSNPARPFGMAADERLRAMAVKAGVATGDCTAGKPRLYANLAYAFDPAWFGALVAAPGSVLVKDGKPVLAHMAASTDARAVLEAMEKDAPYSGDLTIIDADTAELSYAQLRKRDRPFVMRLEPADPEPVERAAYDASYKGVTDLLTLYLWRKAAFYLTRWAARAGMTPNQVTMIGFVFCVAAFFLFWEGWYWTGVASGFVFMVLDTVDGKLARCTGQSSWWGNIFDHGIDLIHPPFWWWAWVAGLGAVGLAMDPVYESMVLGIVIGGYIVQRVTEGVFMRRFGMHIHVWQQIDSRFRLVTARRNPNMVILVGSLLFGRPDVGIKLVALWTIISLIFHAVRLAQASARRDRGEPVTSWLA